MGSQQLYSLSWGEFGTSLTSTVQVLRGHGEMIDVTLAAGGRIFPAHKLVLSAASPLLMELLKSTHCHHPVVMLAGITASDLEALLQFVYQGEVSVDPSQLPSLLQAAHCLDIQALSPQTLTTEKTMAQISVPVVMNDGMNNSIPSMSRDQSITSPLLPVRKRKRKQHRGSETDRGEWGVGGVAVESQTLDSNVDSMVTPGDEAMKDEIIEEQHCNGEPATTKKLVSDLPVECTVCGVTLRQSRNLRRHMELIHLKNQHQHQLQEVKSEPRPQQQPQPQLAATSLSAPQQFCGYATADKNIQLQHQQVENGGKQRKNQVKDESKKSDEEPIQVVQSVQTLTEVVNPLDVPGGVGDPGPSRMPPPPPPNMLTSPPLYHSDPYTQLQFTHQTSADVFREQQQQHLLRNAGLYADTREQHCATD